MSTHFDRFTERARMVLTLAQDEAQRFNHNFIGTEHLLLGLVREGEGVAATVLSNLDVQLDQVRASVEAIIGRGEHRPIGEIGLTPRAKKVIELTVDEARRLGHHYVGTEHLLLGLIREGEGLAASVLENLGVGLEEARSEVMKILAGGASSSAGERVGDPTGPWGRGSAASDEGWEYAVLYTVLRRGGIEVETVMGHSTPLQVQNLRLHHALDLMGGEGWELAAIDPTPARDAPGTVLYLFKRPR